MYRWIITKDRISTDTEVSNVGGRGGNAWHIDALTSNPQHFSLYDDDKICYAEGMMYSTDDDHNTEEALFSPLDSFARGYWGCTDIKVDGDWV